MDASLDDNPPPNANYFVSHILNREMDMQYMIGNIFLLKKRQILKYQHFLSPRTSRLSLTAGGCSPRKLLNTIVALISNKYVAKTVESHTRGKI